MGQDARWRDPFWNGRCKDVLSIERFPVGSVMRCVTDQRRWVILSSDHNGYALGVVLDERHQPLGDITHVPVAVTYLEDASAQLVGALLRHTSERNADADLAGRVLIDPAGELHYVHASYRNGFLVMRVDSHTAAEFDERDGVAIDLPNGDGTSAHYRIQTAGQRIVERREAAHWTDSAATYGPELHALVEQRRAERAGRFQARRGDIFWAVVALGPHFRRVVKVRPVIVTGTRGNGPTTEVSVCWASSKAEEGPTIWVEQHDKGLRELTMGGVGFVRVSNLVMRLGHVDATYAAEVFDRHREFLVERTVEACRSAKERTRVQRETDQHHRRVSDAFSVTAWLG